MYLDTRLARSHARLGFVGKSVSEAPQLCGVDGQKIIRAVRMHSVFVKPLLKATLLSL